MSSKISLDLMTPTKSAKMSYTQSISPKKSNSGVYRNLKLSNSSYRSKEGQAQSAQNSLIEKIVESQISTETSYQNILIHNKELQIKILGLEQEAQKLKKQLKKINRPIQQVKLKVQKARISLIEKQKYLEKFYIHLDSKLKSNMQSNLFGRLQKIQSALQQKYSTQRIQLFAGLNGEHSKIQEANQELQKLRQYRDKLIKQQTQKAIEVSSNRGYSQNNSASRNNLQAAFKSHGGKSSEKKSYGGNSAQKKSQRNEGSQKNSQLEIISSQINNKNDQARKRKQQKALAKQQIIDECQFLRDNIGKLRKQKQIVQKDEKLLKTLLNIDQQHKKYSTYIITGYKKMFTIKYRDILCKRKQQLQKQTKQPVIKPKSLSIAVPDLDKLQKQLSHKMAEKKTLQRQIDERNIGLDECKQKLNEEIIEYSQLEQEIMQGGNKGQYPNNRLTYNNNSKSSKGYEHQTYNPRATYGAGQSYSGGEYNNRSTYTSYQKKSFDGEEDL